MKDLAAVVAEDAVAPAPDRVRDVTRRGAKSFLFALSLASLVLAGSWFPLLSDADYGYFNKTRVDGPSLAALLANTAWMTLLFWRAASFVKRTPKAGLRFVGHLAFFMVLLIPIDFARSNLLGIPDFRMVAWARTPLGWAAAGLVAGLVCWQHVRVARLLAVGVGLLSPLALFTLARVLLLLLGVTHLRQHGEELARAPLLPVRPDLPRVVWLVFDELDQRLTFERRPDAVSLPALAELSRQALVATNAYPPGDATVISLPALITGIPLATVKVVGHSELDLTREADDETVPWSRQSSIFSQARALGANTALVGWYHPYSRLLAPAVSHCDWQPLPSFDPVGADQFSVALTRQLQNLLQPVHLRRLFIDICRSGAAQAEALAADPTYQVMLLHLAPPHKPAVYLAAEDRFTPWGVPKVAGYFQSLVLVDRIVGRTRAAIRQAGLDSRTWLIVSSDHWWREAEVHDGHLDHRVPFLVCPPGDHAGQNFAGILNTVLTHDLILAILRREVTDVASVRQWLEPRQLPAPPPYRYRHSEQ